MKTHIQKLNKEVNWEGRRYNPNNSVIDAQVLFFILLIIIIIIIVVVVECSSVLNL